MNHLSHQKLRTDCAEFEVLMTGCYSGSTGHAGPVVSPAGLLSFQGEIQGKCVTAPLWTAHAGFWNVEAGG